MATCRWSPAKSIADCLQAQARTGLALLAFEPADPAAYGRVLMTPDGFLDRIVEFKDASGAERAITLVQCRLLCRRRAEFLPLGRGAEERQCAEGILSHRRAGPGAHRTASNAPSPWPTRFRVTGVNSRAELAEAERKFQDRVRARLLADGVTMTAPETVFFAHDTEMENDVEIEPFVVFGPGVTVKTGARIRSHSHLEGAACRVRRHHRALCAPAARRGDRRGRPYRQFRGSEERGDRRPAPRPII